MGSDEAPGVLEAGSREGAFILHLLLELEPIGHRPHIFLTGAVHPLVVVVALKEIPAPCDAGKFSNLGFSNNNPDGMLSDSNKQLMQAIFTELSRGNDQPFLDAMADDMQWHWMGSGPWSKTFAGKAAVVGELWAAVRTTLQPPYKVTASRFIADGDHLAVEAVGENATPDGKMYNNRYCWVVRIEGGMIRELREYMDTDLVTKTFL